jgi:hypothetical protein
VRAVVKLLDVYADRSPRDGDRDEIAGVRHGMLEAAAVDDRLSMRLAALAASPVEAHAGRVLAGVPRERGLRELAPDQETLAVLLAPVGRPALVFCLVE